MVTMAEEEEAWTEDDEGTCMGNGMAFAPLVSEGRIVALLSTCEEEESIATDDDEDTATEEDNAELEDDEARIVEDDDTAADEEDAATEEKIAALEDDATTDEDDAKSLDDDTAGTTEDDDWRPFSRSPQMSAPWAMAETVRKPNRANRKADLHMRSNLQIATRSCTLLISQHETNLIRHCRIAFPDHR